MIHKLRNRRKALKSVEIDTAYEQIEDMLETLAAEGLIYDTGKRRWSERAGRYLTVWASTLKKLQ